MGAHKPYYVGQHEALCEDGRIGYHEVLLRDGNGRGKSELDHEGVLQIPQIHGMTADRLLVLLGCLVLVFLVWASAFCWRLEMQIGNSVW